MRKLFLILIIGASFNSNCQEVILPMKGNYIYYNFTEETNNKKYCINHYFYIQDSLGINGSAYDLIASVGKKCSNLNELKVTLVGLKNTIVSFSLQGKLQLNSKCTGEIQHPLAVNLTLPTGAMLLEGHLLFDLFTIGKFKVSSQKISASVKIKIESENKYSLIFTNFQINYTGTQGVKFINETLNLEDVYNSLKKNGTQNNKMYDKGMESMREMDEIIKGCARIYSEELKRVYEIDEL